MCQVQLISVPDHTFQLQHIQRKRVLRYTKYDYHSFLTIHSHFNLSTRVWKGIFGIRDLTKIQCGNRENDKYIDGIRDLTVPREAGLAQN